MIVEYHRPKTLDQAIMLLARQELHTVPIGGGSAIDRFSREPFAVVDLQDLGLDQVLDRVNFLDLGATLTLQNVLETPNVPEALARAVRHEAARNLRQVATVAGTLVAGNGRSPFATAMLALDATLALYPGEGQADGKAIGLGDYLSFRPEGILGRIITLVTIPVKIRLAYHYVARTPADRPIVCVAVSAWPSGRTRVALGGYGAAPALAMDGPEPGGAEEAARNAFSQAGDEWASAEYRQEVAGVLVGRCMEDLT